MHNAVMQPTEHFEHFVSDQEQMLSTSSLPLYPPSTFQIADPVMDSVAINHSMLSSRFSSMQQDKQHQPSSGPLEGPGLLHVLSPMGEILYCSGASFAMTGYSPNELVGQCWMDFVHADDLDSFCGDLARAFRMQSQIKSQFRFRTRGKDAYVLMESFGHPNRHHLFAIAHPFDASHSQKRTATIDACRELTMENEWLKHRLAELTTERQDFATTQARSHSPYASSTQPAWARSSSDQNGSLSDRPKWKRREAVMEEYTCMDCGVMQSPEWRKGPQGPKTLCNACGLRWAKKVKRQHDVKQNQEPRQT